MRQERKVRRYTLFLVLLCGCSASLHPVDAKHPKSLGYGLSEDDLSTLVCSKVCGSAADLNPAEVVDSSEDPKEWEPRLARVQQAIDDLEKWSNTTLPDCPLRSEYHSWIWYFRRELSESRDELHTHSELRSFQKYMAQQEEQTRRLRDLNVPAPPKR